MCQDSTSSSPKSTIDSARNGARLSNRELQILTLLVHGLSNRELAKELNVSVETVKTHMRNILRKLAASGRTEAATKALESELVRFDP